MDPEFTLLMNLPPEMIANVCSEMNDQQLSRFLSSSKQAKEICEHVLNKRQQGYEGRIEAILNAVDSNREISLESPSSYAMGLIKLPNGNYAWYKFLDESEASTSLNLSREKMRKDLTDKFHKGDITGNYSAPKQGFTYADRP